MKKLTRILALALLMVTVLSLVACSSYSAILKNFTDAGYEEVEIDEDSTAKTLTANLENGDLSCTVHLLKVKGTFLSHYAMILEFSSDKELTKAISEDDNVMSLISAFQESQIVRDNCLLIPLSITEASSMIKLFNEGK
ncbi:MAG: hypothetical protein IJY12_03600 [Clostridia bacterium]|nr:hypothetical protein [Clostridia bacterium]